jgi:predicted Ser/Thr protein kinase
VDKENHPFIVDFETASVVGKSLMSHRFASFFLWETAGQQNAGRSVWQKQKSELIAALKNFKKNANRKNFDGLLEMCLPQF